MKKEIELFFYSTILFGMPQLSKDATIRQWMIDALHLIVRIP